MHEKTISHPQYFTSLAQKAWNAVYSSRQGDWMPFVTNTKVSDEGITGTGLRFQSQVLSLVGR